MRIRPHRASDLCFGVLLALLSVSASSAIITVRADTISGRVFEPTSGLGIGGITVQLLPPSAVRAPVRVTTTASDGGFQFIKLAKGKYLLRMYQGMTLVYQKEIDTNVDAQFTVPLRRVP
jgi:hypothetical protein